MRCHELQNFGHVKSECRSYKKTLSNAMNATFTDDGSSSNNRNENSNRDERVNSIA